MSDEPATIENITEQIKAAINGGELSDFQEFLHPAVSWGAPDDPSPTCQNRDQVLAFYRNGRTSGTRARVTETVIWDNGILLGLVVTSAKVARELVGNANRWQAYTVSAGLITEIVGFDTREEAFAYAERT